MDSWKNKKVVCFKWKHYVGFYPHTMGVVLEETDKECLVKVGILKKIWTFKHIEEKTKTGEMRAGYCKIIY